MGTTTTRGIPYPFGFEGNNVPVDLLALAARLDAMLSPRTYAEIGALGGVDLWDGRLLTQSDTGVLRPWAGMYAYKAATTSWQAVVPRASTPFTPTLKFAGVAATMGTAAESVGQVSRFGSLILARFVIFTGTAGFSAPGSTVWTIDLPGAQPYKESAVPSILGVMTGIDQLGAVMRLDLVSGLGSALTVTGYKAAGGLGSNPNQAFFAGGWTNNQTYLGTLLYETPEA